MNHSLPFVTIYTITYNQAYMIGSNIRSLWNQSYPKENYEIIILNDGSFDTTGVILDNLSKESPVSMRIITVDHESHYMSARRWNQCIQATLSKTEIFIQIDDVNVRNDFIEQHVKWHRAGEKFMVTGSKFEGYEETWNIADCRRSFLVDDHNKPVECDYQAAWGASLSFSRSMMTRVINEPYDLPYDERMLGWGYQEIEFAYRMKSAGARIVYDPSVGVFHKMHTSNNEKKRGLSRKELIENGSRQNIKYLCKKHGLTGLPAWQAPLPIDF